MLKKETFELILLTCYNQADFMGNFLEDLSEPFQKVFSSCFYRRKGWYFMATKTLYTVIVADDEDELREAVCTMVP